MASVYTLPEEVLLKIFSYLQPKDVMFGVRRTCHYFHDLSLEPSLWTHVTITNFAPEISSSIDIETPVSNFVSEKFYRKLLQQKCIRRGVGGCEVSGPKKKRQTGKGLDTVPIKNVIRSIKERGKVWSRCSATRPFFNPHLTRFTLDRGHLPSFEFLAKYGALQFLDLKVDFCLKPSSKNQNMIGLFESLKCLTNLQILKFVCSDGHTQTRDFPPVTDSLVKYFSMGPRLRQIELNSFVNFELLKAILDHCLQLENLALANLKLTPKDSFTAVSKDPRRLFSLRMEHCQNLNDDCLKCMSLIFPNLKSLHLSLTEKMTDDGVRLLLGACPHLTSLKLTLPHVHNSENSAEMATIRGNCLKELHRSGNLQCLVLENFTRIPETVFRDLFQNQQNLRTIELRKCVVDNSDLMALAGSCRLLQTVTVKDCPAVDSAGVSFLMTNLPRLQTLNCQLHRPRVMKLKQLQPFRKRTRSGGLVLLDQPRTWLSSLELAVCQEMTGANVSALASLCPYLRSLHLQGANFVNDLTIRMVLRSFPQLQDLRLASLSKVANEENQLTSDCLSDIHRWGQGLQSLQLVTFFRSFTVDDLARHIARSPSLVRCCVPMFTKPSEDTRAGVIKDIKEKIGQMSGGKKTAVAWEADCDEDECRLDVSRRLLCICIYH